MVNHDSNEVVETFQEDYTTTVCNDISIGVLLICVWVVPTFCCAAMIHHSFIPFSCN